MGNHANDANGGSVQENATINENPTDTTQASASVVGSAADGQDTATHHEPSGLSPLLLTDKQEVSFAKAKIQTGMVPVALLHPYAKNSEIYEDREDPPFTENIREHGVMNPLIVKPDGSILGGNRRWRAAKKAGRAEVPVVVVECKSEDEELQRLLDDNLYREKTNEEKTREYIVQKQIETRKAAVRKAEAPKKTTPAEDGQTVTPPAEKKGKARDLAAEKFHLTGVTADKGRKVVEAADKLRKEGDAETANQLMALLNESGFEPAFKRAEVLQLIEKAKKNGNQDKAAKKAVATPPVEKSDGDAAQESEPGSAEKGKTAAAATKGATHAPEETPSQTETQTLTAVDADQPPVVRIIAAMTKDASDLESLDLAAVTSDQKLNLTRAFNGLSDWFDKHDLMLKAPGQP